ncbi:unnamed protein product [Didymodactylos carnosus]|uniref:Mesoderm induction early response protein 1 n=1 Tax=Didymodactylos carnosus TaxID=1234261 RepID=A0A814W1X9_9BILA|nr:unnamed protein product [Didymodactylos carnosus]CAF1195928.1 unnamed protein product [Didymodactylos carnosus]CAF3828232.1 unnamed protein product [Didymodactylos carnosus]CAF3960332.1 unnamed protein product [Didymodactylos carnosus]
MATNSPTTITESDADTDYKVAENNVAQDEYDDERTIDEEEQNQTMSAEDIQSELAELQAESEMPISELLKLYSFVPNTTSNRVQRNLDESSMSSTDESTSTSHDAEYQNLLTNNTTGQLWKVNKHSVILTQNLMKNQKISYLGTSDGNDEEDTDPSYSLEWQKSISVGDQFQALVPELTANNSNTSIDKDQTDIFGQLLWSPSNIDDALIDQYLKEACKEFPTADQEVALEIFMSCSYELDQALEKFRVSNKNIFSMTPWSINECDLFEKCFKEYGKDFYKMHLFKLTNRSVRELVNFYYIWKKTERHDIFVQKNPVEKRRFHLHPFVTDYLEKFLDEQEQQLMNTHDNGGVTSSNSLLSADIKRRSPLPNSIASITSPDKRPNETIEISMNKRRCTVEHENSSILTKNNNTLPAVLLDTFVPSQENGGEKQTKVKKSVKTTTSIVVTKETVAPSNDDVLAQPTSNIPNTIIQEPNQNDSVVSDLKPV